MSKVNNEDISSDLKEQKNNEAPGEDVIVVEATKERGQEVLHAVEMLFGVDADSLASNRIDRWYETRL